MTTDDGARDRAEHSHRIGEAAFRRAVALGHAEREIYILNVTDSAEQNRLRLEAESVPVDECHLLTLGHFLEIAAFDDATP